MKCVIPEISWHNRDPVLSVDIQPKRDGDTSDVYRLASGGTDSHVLIWYVQHNEAGQINLDIAANLTRHQRPVNVVRWSPSGEFLASGDDESIIFVWKLKSDTETINILDSTNDQDKEIWLTYKIMRGHMEDVYDLCWAPNSQQLISGSVDNTAMVWDVLKGKSQAILREHNSFVQGVAWDPQNQFLATLSSDRHFRLFDVATKKMRSCSHKSVLPFAADSPLHGKVMRIFHDDTLQTFFRRLAFSPDGELIVTPSGVAETAEEPKPLHTTYVYTRYNTKKPSLVLPSPDQYTVAVRFCPILYKLRPHDDDTPPMIDLPYRMIFAVATKSSVYLYDTQQPMPFGLISNIHYTRLTDLSWSKDGRLLIVSSTDGFCTLITFAVDELGVEYSDDEAKENGSKCATALNVLNKGAVGDTTSEKETGNVANDSMENKVLEVSKNAKVSAEALKEQVVSANPIAIRRKPRPTTNSGVAAKPEEVEKRDTAVSVVPQVIVVNTPEKVIALEIPTGIISIKDKFDSPEITITKPATPISFRRAPRTTDSPSCSASKQSPGHFNAIGSAACSTTEDVSAPVVPPLTVPGKTPKSTKKANPIAIRRYQRNILPECGGKVMDRSATEDEAMDAWPIDQPRPLSTADAPKPAELSEDVPVLIKPNEKSANVGAPMDVDGETEDIRLVYDDESQAEEVMATGTNEASPSGDDEAVGAKTPRRVELRTISTPKAKKKL